MKGIAKISIGDYNELIFIKKNYFKIMELVAERVELRRLVLEQYANEGKEDYYFTVSDAIIGDICEITGWQHSEIDKINVESCRKKAEKVREQKAEGQQGVD